MAKKKKKEKNPEQSKRRGFLAIVFLIVLATAVIGIKLISLASWLGVLVLLGGSAGAVVFFVINMNRFRIYETVTDRTRKNEEKAGEKLAEDMEKCKAHIAELDARAGVTVDDKGAEEAK